MNHQGTLPDSRRSILQEKQMQRLWISLLVVARDQRGQDMVEYALLAGFIAVAAGAVLPPVADNLSIIFSRIGSVVEQGATN
jgi:pilus assembly protein Flp/PilA